MSAVGFFVDGQKTSKFLMGEIFKTCVLGKKLPDFLGGIIGILSVLVIYFLWKHAEALSDGNVDKM
jgi:L-lactate permease